MKLSRKALLFLVITFTVNIAMVVAFKLFHFEYKGVPATILALIYMFVPMISALIVEKGIYKQEVLKSLKINFNFNKWVFIGWFLPLILTLLTLGISLLIPEVSFSWDMEGMFDKLEGTLTSEQIEQMRNSMKQLPIHPVWITIIQGLIAGITINAIAAFGEELGWRGLLLKELKGASFWKGSLLIGFIWGIWHAPLVLMGHNYPQHPELGVAMMTFWCMLLSPMFTYITLKAKSVIAAAILHGTLNGLAGVAIMVIVGGSDLLVGLTGFAGFFALAFLISWLFLYDKYLSKEHIMSENIDKFW